MVVGLWASFAARADQGVIVGARPLVRLRWPAVIVGGKPVPSTSEVVVLADGRVTWLESHEGAAFLLRQFPAVPAGLSLLKSELGRWGIGKFGQTCRLTSAVFVPSDRVLAPVDGEPLRLNWYGPGGRRTSELALGTDPASPPCPLEAVNAVSSVLQYVGAVQRTSPAFSTGFLPRLRSGERRISGRVNCEGSTSGIAARIQLFASRPVECWPEICFFLDPPLLAETTSAADGSYALNVPSHAVPSPRGLWLFATPLASCSWEFGAWSLPPEPLNTIDLPIDQVFDPPG